MIGSDILAHGKKSETFMISRSYDVTPQFFYPTRVFSLIKSCLDGSDRDLIPERKVESSTPQERAGSLIPGPALFFAGSISRLAAGVR